MRILRAPLAQEDSMLPARALADYLRLVGESPSERQAPQSDLHPVAKLALQLLQRTSEGPLDLDDAAVVCLAHELGAVEETQALEASAGALLDLAAFLGGRMASPGASARLLTLVLAAQQVLTEISAEQQPLAEARRDRFRQFIGEAPRATSSPRQSGDAGIPAGPLARFALRSKVE